jgi:hypothetical protein
MRKIYNKPTLKVVELAQRYYLLSSSDPEHSGGEAREYRGDFLDN